LLTNRKSPTRSDFSIEGVGSLIFDNISGSYFNILGLPMMKLTELFRELGLDILDFINT